MCGIPSIVNVASGWLALNVMVTRRGLTSTERDEDKPLRVGDCKGDAIEGRIDIVGVSRNYHTAAGTDDVVLERMDVIGMMKDNCPFVGVIWQRCRLRHRPLWR